MSAELKRYHPSVAQEPYGRIIHALASLLTSPRTDAQCDADVQPSDPVRVAVQTIKAALDEIMMYVPKIEAAPGAPAGFKLVPIEPTPAMCKAAADAWLDSKGALTLNRAGAALRAGIAAAKDTQ